MFSDGRIYSLNLGFYPLHMRRFSPHIWIQENIAFTGDGLNHKSGFIKILPAPEKPLHTKLLSQKVNYIVTFKTHFLKVHNEPLHSGEHTKYKVAKIFRSFLSFKILIKFLDS